MPNPAAPASSAPVTAGAAVARALSGTDGKIVQTALGYAGEQPSSVDSVEVIHKSTGEVC